MRVHLSAIKGFHIAVKSAVQSKLVNYGRSAFRSSYPIQFGIKRHCQFMR